MQANECFSRIFFAMYFSSIDCFYYVVRLPGSICEGWDNTYSIKNKFKINEDFFFFTHDQINLFVTKNLSAIFFSPESERSLIKRLWLSDCVITKKEKKLGNVLHECTYWYKPDFWQLLFQMQEIFYNLAREWRILRVGAMSYRLPVSKTVQLISSLTVDHNPNRTSGKYFIHFQVPDWVLVPLNCHISTSSLTQWY